LAGSRSGRGLEPGRAAEIDQDICRYYDWRGREARLNRFAQFTTTIDGLDIHTSDVRSPYPGAMPLLITHGWPGSVVEFHKVIEPLPDPTAHGGNAADALHVVCPSLPGFGIFANPKTNRLERRSCCIELGGADGTSWLHSAIARSWGSAITTALSAQDPGHCAGIHIMWSLNRLSSVRPSLLLGVFDFMPPWGRCQLYRCSQIGSSSARRSDVG
jgi:hypothetical protein